PIGPAPRTTSRGSSLFGIMCSLQTPRIVAVAWATRQPRDGSRGTLYSVLKTEYRASLSFGAAVPFSIRASNHDCIPTGGRGSVADTGADTGRAGPPTPVGGQDRLCQEARAMARGRPEGAETETGRPVDFHQLQGPRREGRLDQGARQDRRGLVAQGRPGARGGSAGLVHQTSRARTHE